MNFRSQIRDTTINRLLEKARERNYGKYLSRLTLRHVRGFRDEPVSFDFPVTALIGPNGGGKTTVLGAAGIIYRDIPPRMFFAKSGKYDAGMQDWAIEYEIVDRESSSKTMFRELRASKVSNGTATRCSGRFWSSACLERFPQVSAKSF